jgi:hypothetical protein
MAGGWLDITDGAGRRRHVLQTGLTRIARDGDVAHGAAGDDELHVWDQPPRAVFVGSGDPPTSAGRPFEELPLRPGSSVAWRGMTVVYGGQAAPADQAPLQELPAEPAPPPPRAEAAARAPEEERVWSRLKAGMLVELGIADRVTAKRWQDAVVSNAFDPDRCAQDILARSAVAPGEPRLLERSARLLRDLLMAPLFSGSRGAARRARQATKGVVAMVVSQAVAFGVYTAIVLAAMLLLRLRDVSFDAFLDRILPGR